MPHPHTKTMHFEPSAGTTTQDMQWLSDKSQEILDEFCPEQMNICGIKPGQYHTTLTMQFLGGIPPEEQWQVAQQHIVEIAAGQFRVIH